jgi:hypothetical protein
MEAAALAGMEIRVARPPEHRLSRVVPVGAETLANGRTKREGSAAARACGVVGDRIAIISNPTGRVASLKAEVRWARANGGIKGEGSAAARGLGLLLHE